MELSFLLFVPIERESHIIFERVLKRFALNFAFPCQVRGLSSF